MAAVVLNKGDYEYVFDGVIATVHCERDVKEGEFAKLLHDVERMLNENKKVERP